VKDALSVNFQVVIKSVLADLIVLFDVRDGTNDISLELGLNNFPSIRVFLFLRKIGRLCSNSKGN
jgi:hypothetical protein